MTSAKLRPRILLIEDDPVRIAQFRYWLEGTNFVLIDASSGGRALGILRPGMTAGVAGICLDCDLEKQPVTDADLSLSGAMLIGSIARSVPHSVPILIHSMNAQKAPGMVRALTQERFAVTRIQYAVLTQEDFHGWLEEVRNAWEDTL